MLRDIWQYIVLKESPVLLSKAEVRRRQWQPTPVLLLRKSHGWRSLVGCIPWGRYESVAIEQLHFHFHTMEKEMATHSSVLAWRIPGTAEPVGLPSMGSHRAGHDWSDLAAAAWLIINFFFRLSQSLNLDNYSFKISLATLHLRIFSEPPVSVKIWFGYTCKY